MFLTRPDARTLTALARLRNDQDFVEITAWIEHSLNELDRANRATLDPVLMRQHQGGGLALAEIVARARGQDPARAIPTSIPVPIRDGLG